MGKIMENEKMVAGDFLQKKFSQQDIISSINLANALQPERTVILLQILYAINEKQWEFAKELAYSYGSQLKESNIIGRQIFISLILFLNQNLGGKAESGC